MQPHLFPSQEGLIYLNSGSHSRTPLSVLEAVQRYQRDYESNPTSKLLNASERLWDVQKRIASFVGARPQDIYLRANVTLPLTNFILDMPLPTGSAIALTDLEYGAIANVVRYRAERDHLDIKTVTLPKTQQEYDTLSPEEMSARICEQLGPTTKMLVISHIMTGNGLVLPLREIARYTRAKGILLVVDGAHTPGALPLDLSQLSDIDFFAGNLHKWMMGPKGTAFGWVHPMHQNTLPPPNVGWTTYEWPVPFKKFAPEFPFARRFMMTGCFDFAPYFALNDCIDFWEQHNPTAMLQKLGALQTHAQRAGDTLHWKPLSPSTPELSIDKTNRTTRGPLVTWELPEKFQSTDGFEILNHLERNKGLQVMITQINGRSALRLSPHVYNTTNDIDRAVEILRTL